MSADERSSGLIVRTRPLTETSLIINWITPDLGRLSTVAKGALRAKSPFRGKLDLFFLADFSFARSKRSELHNLREVSVREMHTGLRLDLDRLSQASYAAALLEISTERETPLGGLYDLFLAFIQSREILPPEPFSILAFEMKWLTELGLSPNLQESHLSAGAQQILRQAILADWAFLTRLHPSPAQIGEINSLLQHLLIDHFGKIPAGRKTAIAGNF